MRRRKFGAAVYNTTDGTPTVGYLDINFGVLGIFLVIFAIRVALILQNDTGARADVIIESLSSDDETARLNVHLDSKTLLIETQETGELTKRLFSELREGAFASTSPIKILILVAPESLFSEFEISQALKAIKNAEMTEFLPFVVLMEPVIDSSSAQIIVDAWRTND